MQVVTDWKDYTVLDAGNGEKLERWGNVVLRRPDAQVLWPLVTETGIWKQADGHYHRSSSGGGEWDFKKKIPERWTVQYNELKFYVRPTSFKHTGLFPEQAVNWNWMTDKIKKADREIHVLNLFAYTGGATIACASAGANVCHVDASKGIVQWARENANLNGFEQRPIRWIVDDVFKFVEREQRRGRKYDAIIMDPPTYGRGSNGEIWKFEDHLGPFLKACCTLLSDDPLFVLINSYTSGISPTVLQNLLQLTIPKKHSGLLTCGEIGLPIESNELVLPAGIFGRWEA